jgi:hypothetical protein
MEILFLFVAMVMLLFMKLDAFKYQLKMDSLFLAGIIQDLRKALLAFKFFDLI